jgi:hypothetical protein
MGVLSTARIALHLEAQDAYEPELHLAARCVDCRPGSRVSLRLPMQSGEAVLPFAPIWEGCIKWN